jgi:membrane-associated phospholipid phosphatase
MHDPYGVLAKPQSVDFPCHKRLLWFESISGPDRRSFGLFWTKRPDSRWNIRSIVVQSGKDQARIRSTLIVMLLGVAVSIIAARTIAFVVPFEVRPMYASDIGYLAPFGERDYTFEAWSGFPSDQAAMVFSLATGFWFASRLAGILVGLFSIVALVARVYLGIHYPGDIFVGALLGISITALLMSQPIKAALSSPIISLEKRIPALFYGSLFVILFEAGTMFSATRRIGAAVVHVITGNYG